MPEIIYVLVCVDRHVDDEITLHRTQEGADLQIENFKARYRDRVEGWRERDYGRTAGWTRYVESDHDDGPRCRVERKELRP